MRYSQVGNRLALILPYLSQTNAYLTVYTLLPESLAFVILPLEI